MVHDRASRTRRRLLQGSLALAGLGLLTGCGIGAPQDEGPRRRARIALFTLGSLGATAEDHAFRGALRELGWIHGENLAVEYRWARTQEGRAASTADLAALDVDLIVAAGNELGRVATEASPTTPVVIVGSSDPVGSGLVASLSRPGGSVTGLATFSSELSGKRLELLKEVLPGAARVAVIWDPTLAERASEERSLQTASRAMGIELRFLHYRNPNEFSDGVEAARTWPAAALMVLDDSLFRGLDTIERGLPRVPMPTFGGHAALARAGGLTTYGPNIPAMFARAATYVDKILKGTRPADLPIEQPTKFDFVVNLRTAQALGLTIPPSVLDQATEIIQ